jgi:type I restriction enzyme S subunit
MNQDENQMIPEDWSNTNIGDFAPLQRGFDLPNRDRIDGKYPVVYSNGVMNFHNTYQVKGPGVITGRSGTIGKVHYVDGDYWPHNTALWVKQFNNAMPRYVYYLYSHIGFNRFSSGSGVPTLNRNDAHSFAITVPSQKEEQTAIANALSDVDELLTELENLIAKKQAIKTATMQQLLTGKTRLPQFATHTEGEKKGQPKGTKLSELGEIPEDWEIVKFGSIVNYIKGYPFKSAEYTDSGIRVVRVSDTSFTSIKNEKPIFVSESSRRKYKKWSLEKGNIIFTTVGSKPPMYDSLVGKAILVESHHEGFLLNQNAVLIKPKLAAKNISNLLVSHFRTERYIDHIEQIYRGNANQASITLDGLFEFEIPLPTEPEEQTAIATILSDMDEEIQTLGQRLVKTRQIKQGMMQELLTGKTRLPF